MRSISCSVPALVLSVAALAGAMGIAGCAGDRPITAFERPDDAPSTYREGVVASDHPVASRAGAKMLEMGGNAVDAAVATSFALSVVRPYSCGIGGGGFMVVHLVDDPSMPEVGDPLTVCIDYRERASGAMGPTWFEDRPDADSRLSGHAVAVPGTVAGLLHALETYGTMDRREVMQPAIDAARNGFEADPHFVTALNSLFAESGYVEREDGTITLRPVDRSIDPARRAGAMHLFWRFGPDSNRDRYRPVSVGEILKNTEQARVLESIAAEGKDAFYRGPIARRLVDAVQDAGGPLTLEDLASYRPVESDPLVGMFDARGNRYTLIGMPLPSSGGLTIVQTLGILTQYAEQMRSHVGTTPLDARGPSDDAYIHALTECLKHAFANRSRWLADPEFVPVPVDALLEPNWFGTAADRLHPDHTFETETYGLSNIGAQAGAMAMLEDGGTSHLSVVDQWGNAVACTETINLVFGSRVLPVGLGFCLNNEIDDFTTRSSEPNAFGLQQSDANLPEPGKRPLSSMSPTIVLDEDGRVFAVAGASGGPRIITGTLQALLNVLVFDDDAWTAVARSRFHHQWLPDTLRFEPGYLAARPELADVLGERGHQLGDIDEVGVVQLIRRDGEAWQAASDPRKGGEPAGQ